MTLESKVYAHKMIILLETAERIVDVKNDTVYPANRSMIRILRSIENGLSISEIAEKLGISGKSETVEVLQTAICNLVDKDILTFNKDRAGKIFKKQSFFSPALEKLTLETTRKCNFRCNHCYNSSNSDADELSFSSIKSMIESADRMGVFRFDLTGGEFFVRRDAFDILNLMGAHGMIVNLFTNGYLLGEEQLKAIKELEFVRNFYISLDDCDSQKHDSLRNKEGAFQKTIKTIQSLTEMGKQVIVNCTITDDNINRMQDIRNFIVKELGVRFRMAPLINMGRAETMKKIEVDQYINNVRSLGMTPETMEDMFVSSTSATYLPHCGIGSSMIYVMADGTIIPCPLLREKEFYMGNVQQDDIKEIWKSHDLLKSIRSSTCNPKCIHIGKCRGGCRSRAFIKYHSFDMPDPVSCALFPK